LRQHREVNDGRSTYVWGKQSLTIGSASFAAEHDVPAAKDLRAKTEIALPIRAKAEKFRKVPVLKVGDPRDPGKRKTPAIELGALKEHVDAMLAKCVRRGSIRAGH